MQHGLCSGRITSILGFLTNYRCIYIYDSATSRGTWSNVVCGGVVGGVDSLGRYASCGAGASGGGGSYARR